MTGRQDTAEDLEGPDREFEFTLKVVGNLGEYLVCFLMVVNTTST
jgi:hypothetical protein